MLKIKRYGEIAMRFQYEPRESNAETRTENGRRFRVDHVVRCA